MSAAIDSARASLGQCQRKLHISIAASGAITSEQNDQKLSLGIAQDFLRWADSTGEVLYLRKAERNSDRKPVILEATRFSYLWTATDALFNRPGIRQLVGMPPNARKEIVRFKLLLNFANLPAALIHQKKQALLNTLCMEVHIQEPIPGTNRTEFRVWEVVYYKYTTPQERKRGMGQYMHDCLVNGTAFDPDIASIIYASRNWHFHGVILTTGFRGPPERPLQYYRTLNETLGEIHKGVAARFLALL